MSGYNHSYAAIMCRVHEVNGKWEMPPQFYARLARTGQREAFNAEIERLKNEGVEHPIRWAEAAAMFPPVDKVVEAVPVFDTVDGVPDNYDMGEDADVTGHSFQSIIQRDAKWVYLNLGNKKPVDAPSPGARAWLTAVQSDQRARDSFMKDTLPKFLPPAKTLDDAERFSDDGRATLDLLEKCKGGIAR